MDIEQWAKKRWHDVYDVHGVSTKEAVIVIARQAYDKGREDERAAHDEPVKEPHQAILRHDRPASSMTVRERMAMAAMQEILWDGTHLLGNRPAIIRAAVDMADELIAALEAPHG